MMPQMTVLWTDWLIYFLLVVSTGYIAYTRSKPHLLAPWKKVVRNPIAMACSVILLLYVGIGLLDSIHFRQALPQQTSGEPVRYSADIISVFDKLVTPLRSQSEKTYSAPLAVHLFSMESVEQPDGRIARIFPRLKFAGSHLGADVNGSTNDQWRLLLQGSMFALLLWGLLILILLVALARHAQLGFVAMAQRLWRGDTELPWRTLLLTTGIVLWLGTVVLQIAPQYHLFGTDKVGQDVLYLSLKSIRTGLIIGILTTLVMLPFALLFGVMAGYFKGWIDDVIQYIYTVLNSIPSVLLIAAAVLMLQVYMEIHSESFTSVAQRADVRLFFLCLILGVTSWTGLCRLLRAETLKLREFDYVQAAHALGVSHWKIMTRHIVPNVMHIVLITVTLEFSALVLAEAILAYVGVGVDPSMHSWGNMINSARLELAREPMVWWPLAAAFVFMFILVLAANLFADAVRDAFDPRVH